MSTKEKWELLADWASAGATATFNSMSNGNAVQSDVQIDNSGNLAVFCDISISFGSLTSGAGAPYIGFFFYPLNQDGTTYGDNRFGSAAAGPPPYEYYVGNLTLPASTTLSPTGTVRGIILPPGKGKFVIHNGAGVAFAASTNTFKYRVYNRIIGA